MPLWAYFSLSKDICHNICSLADASVTWKWKQEVITITITRNCTSEKKGKPQAKSTIYNAFVSQIRFEIQVWVICTKIIWCVGLKNTCRLEWQFMWYSLTNGNWAWEACEVTMHHETQEKEKRGSDRVYWVRREIEKALFTFSTW